MDVKLSWPSRTSGVHGFEVRLSGQGSESINYVDGEVVHLHLDVRPAAGRIVLNDSTAGRWNRQVELPLPGLSKAGRIGLALHFDPDGVVLHADGAEVAFRDRAGDLLEATRLRTSAGVTGFTRAYPPEAALPRAEPPGRYVGALQRCDGRQVRGWAADLDRPGHPVALEVRVGERVLGTVLADQSLPRLEMLGLGLGRSGFVLRYAERLAVEDVAPLTVSVRVLGQAVELRHSPWWLVRPGAETTLQPLVAPAGTGA